MAKKQESSANDVTNSEENSDTRIAEDGTCTIKATRPKEGREVTYSRSFGKDLEEAVSMFGAEVVHSIFQSQAIIRSQGAARTALKSGLKDDEAVAAGLAYTPGVQRKGGGRKAADPVAAIAAKVKSGEMTKEELLALVDGMFAE